MMLTKEQVLDFIPHRSPFLFIDTIEKTSLGDREISANDTLSDSEILGIEVISNFHVDENLPIFKGHFPNYPLLPGVIHVEMIAQTAAFSHYPVFKSNKEHISVVLASVENAKIRKEVLPGANLKTVVKLVKLRGRMSCHEGKIYSKDELVSEARIMSYLKGK